MLTIDKVFIKNVLGIPFKYCGRSLKGLDCFGLLLLYYDLVLGIKLPDISYNIKKLDNEDLLILYLNQNHLFQDLEINSLKQRGDIAILKSKHKTPHFGIILDNLYILHTNKMYGVKVDTFLQLEHEILGFKRFINGK